MSAASASDSTRSPPLLALFPLLFLTFFAYLAITGNPMDRARTYGLMRDFEAAEVIVQEVRTTRKDEVTPAGGEVTTATTKARLTQDTLNSTWERSNTNMSQAVFLKIPKTGTTSMGEMLGSVAGSNSVRWRMCTMAFANMHKRGTANMQIFTEKAFLPPKRSKISCDAYYPPVRRRGRAGLKSAEAAEAAGFARLGFAGHLRFIDFGRFGKKNPVWFTQVRDPVHKFVSMYDWLRRQDWAYSYYMHRKGWKSKETLKEWKNRTVETCVEALYPECRFDRGREQNENTLVAYLCGVDSHCDVLGDPRALQQAKDNTQRFFPVIGVLERLNETLAVMQDRLPEFFTGLAQQKAHVSNGSPSGHQPVSSAAAAYLDSAFKDDREIYQMLEQRLMRQHEQINKVRRKEI